MKIVVFIDYDNLLDRHRLSGIFDVTTKVLLQTPLTSPNNRGSCDVRVYGGWYEGPCITRRAQELSAEIGNQFPSIIRVPNIAGQITSFIANAELAVSMMEEPSHHLFGTYRKKSKPGNLRVQKPTDVGCTTQSCPLPLAKNLLKSGRCPKQACLVTADDLVYRHEQKIVDTMLACDMLFAPMQSYSQLILVSGDDDFLPPLRTVLLRGTPVARFHPKPNRIRTAVPMHGAQLIDADL